MSRMNFDTVMAQYKEDEPTKFKFSFYWGYSSDSWVAKCFYDENGKYMETTEPVTMKKGLSMKINYYMTSGGGKSTDTGLIYYE